MHARRLHQESAAHTLKAVGGRGASCSHHARWVVSTRAVCGHVLSCGGHTQIEYEQAHTRVLDCTCDVVSAHQIQSRWQFDLADRLIYRIIVSALGCSVRRQPRTHTHTRVWRHSVQQVRYCMKTCKRVCFLCVASVRCVNGAVTRANRLTAASLDKAVRTISVNRALS